MKNLLFLMLITPFFHGCLNQGPDYSQIISYVNETSKMKVEHIPDSVFKMTNLRSLSIIGMDCDYNLLEDNGKNVKDCWMIKEIPKKIKNLQNLEYLDLSVNAINEIPSGIGELKKLKIINLSDNPGIEDIIPLTKVISLEELYLYGCNLNSIPKEIGQLKNLKKLGLTGNNIDETEKKRVKKDLINCEIIFN